MPLSDGPTSHKLRHTFASILVALGVYPGSVVNKLGHANPGFILCVYRPASPETPCTRYYFLRYPVQAMPGRVYTQLLEMAQDQHGYLRTEDVRHAGVDPKRLVDYERRGIAERVAYGVYRMKGIPPDELDEYMRAALWPMGAGVLSHETALDLYELCDVNPPNIEVTVPRGYRTHRPVPALYRLHHRDLTSEQVGRLQGLPIVTPLRAILDAVETHVRGELIERAIQAAEQQSLITSDGAASARDTHAARYLGTHS